MEERAAGSRTRKRVEVTRQKAIALKCLECSGSSKEVTLCHLFDCPLWEFRCGYSISTTRYKQRIESAFSRYTKDLEEIRKLGVDTAFFKIPIKKTRISAAISKNRMLATCKGLDPRVEG
jgi:hypothetical protein